MQFQSPLIIMKSRAQEFSSRWKIYERNELKNEYRPAAVVQ